jgi:hypothetical protein
VSVPSSSLTRLIAAVVVLAALDPFVPRMLERAERARYEGAGVFRFAYSDLFGIGPVTEYLREHPRGDRPRAVFFGNSIVWGYHLPEQDSLPVQFQRRNPSTRVLNFAVNRFGIGSAALMLKDVIDSVDLVVFHASGGQVDRGLASIIPVSDEDVAKYRLDPPDRVEQRLEAALGTWRLYRFSYRLQLAWLGTSTRYYVYLHKGSLTGRAPAEDYAPNPPAPAGPRVLRAIGDADLPAARLRELAAAEPVLWDTASLVRSHGKRAIVWGIDNATAGPRANWTDLNRAFLGSCVFATIAVPPEMMIDELHLSANGSAAVAEVLTSLAADLNARGRGLH